MLNSSFNYIPLLNPLIHYASLNIGEYSGVNIVKREVPIVVSISSYEEHFGDLELTLYSIFNQSVQADRIILWLSDRYELAEIPYYITRYIKNGLEIKFIKDLGVYNKVIYGLKDFGNAIVVCAEDNIIYPKNWLKKLYHSYITNPEDIHLHTALKVVVNNSNLTSINEWFRFAIEENSDYCNFILTEGGVLFPPRCFTNEIFRDDLYIKNAPTSAEVWLWFMALVSGRKIRVVKNHIKHFRHTNIFEKIFCSNFKKNIQKYDEQIQNLMLYYRQNIMQKLS